MTVTPGGTASTSLTVRNDSDIVEAYSLHVVGDCAAWTTVEPDRVSLYPGSHETVTVRLAPPRSPEVRAGDVPLAIRVLPAEHPESVRVPETTVHVEEFRELRAEVLPRRRRGWLRGRYRVAVRNEGNTSARIACAPEQAGEELRFGFAPAELSLEPGESAETRLRVRTGRPVWFGKPMVWPFTVRPGDLGVAEEAAHEGAVQPRLEAEFVQLPVFPRWLPVVLAALIALVLAWFALVRPAVRSTAREAADAAVRPRPTPALQNGPSPGAGSVGAAGSGQAGGGADRSTKGPSGGGEAGSGTGGAGGQQSSATIDLETSRGQTETGLYVVPQGKVFGVTDIVVANFQGDEGLMTITFGDRKITTIALETFRNQDYHWVTPIKIPESAAVTVKVTCAKPGTPATGRQAQQCHEVLNVSGVVSDVTHP
ncbi:hydrolytic protein [Streptomyces actuosus]|uniref:Hydrolytic protein n=1 Tax=Streptomyces actuosus TaxID=1885 RepID=A0ABS2VX40_STRAS|nr:hydrolytic protein [Streptomyces actuosus]MBN0047599.1 hydrolytic protein [Streptomyces actuosus]